MEDFLLMLGLCLTLHRDFKKESCHFGYPMPELKDKKEIKVNRLIPGTGAAIWRVTEPSGTKLLSM
jgi:hypothetical protein